MGDLIDRDALKATVKAECDKCTSAWKEKCKVCSLNSFLRYVDNAPSVELVVARASSGVVMPLTRPLGEWIGNAFDEHHCNRCGHPALWEEEPDDYYEVQSRFCPNCGAEMLKEQTDNEQ